MTSTTTKQEFFNGDKKKKEKRHAVHFQRKKAIPKDKNLFVYTCVIVAFVRASDSFRLFPVIFVAPFFPLSFFFFRERIAPHRSHDCSLLSLFLRSANMTLPTCVHCSHIHLLAGAPLNLKRNGKENEQK